MATYKALGQVAPAATTATTAYTVPASTQAIINRITVCNRSATADKFRIALRPDGASLANEHYFAYDVDIKGNETIVITLGMTLDSTDVVTVYSTNGTLTFNVSGVENP